MLRRLLGAAGWDGPVNPATVALGEFDRLAAELGRRLDSLATVVRERLRDRVASPERLPAPDWGRIEALIRDSLAVQLASFRRGKLPERCPEVDEAAVATLAGVPELELLLNGYRASQITLWEAWFASVEDSPLVDAAQRRELLARGSDFFFRYADLLSDYVTEAHQRQLALLQGNGEQRRLRAVAALLDGDPLAAAWLDFELDRYHLGAIAWGEDPLAAARQLAAALGRPLLAVKNPLQRGPSCWLWVSAGRPLDPAQERRLSGFQPAAGRVALGLEAFGEAGFRATHRQAMRARRFAAEDGPALLRYEDVVVEALASENLEDARAFVAHELHGIGDDSAASRRIRETLAAYFAAEHNAASAAATLGVHQQTVANRLRAAEERLGQRSIGARHVELELALRLRHSLTQADPTGA